MSADKYTSPIALGTAGIILGLITICVQITVTSLTDSYEDRYGNRGLESVITLDYVSAGIWIGTVYIFSGITGVIGGTRRKKPAVGSFPTRSLYTGLTVAFLVLSGIAVILSTILVGISAAISSGWIEYNPSLFRTFGPSQIPLAITCLSLFLLVLGLFALPVFGVSCCSAWRILQRAKSTGHVIFLSGAPSAINLHRSQSQIQVVTRPADQVFKTATSPRLVALDYHDSDCSSKSVPSFYF